MKFLKYLLAAFAGTLIALLICMLITFSIIGSLTPSEKPAVVEPSSILKIDLGTSIGEQGAEDPFDISGLIPIGMASTNRLGLLDIVQAIDNAATDPNIKFIYIDNCSFSQSISHLEEIRDALMRFRNSGKPIIAYGDNFTQGGYYIASTADKIYSDPLASNLILGVSTSIYFLKDILDKFDIDVQLIRHGKYKSAGEQFIANDISEANREQNQVMVNSLWETLSNAYAESRGMSADRIDYLVDNLKITTAEEMLAYNLIDSLCTAEQMNGIICGLAGVEDEKDLKTVDLRTYIKATAHTDYKIKDKIAVIYADGQIAASGDEGITSDSFVPMISDIRKDSSVKAVVLRVNSPGGSAQAAELIRQELELLQEVKPLIVSYGSYAASGGYWISAGADKIYSDNSTLTGSIGVFSMVPSFQKAIRNKLHINPVTIRSNEHADMYSARLLDTEERASMQKSVEQIYDLFLKIVSEGRGMATDEVDRIAQGRVWCGNDAIEIGLVNEIGGLTDAIGYAAIAAGLEEYRLAEYPKVKTGLDRLMEGFNTAKAVNEAFTNPAEALESFYGSISPEPGVYAMLPVIYRFN
ncbi:MAG TPA: signal peptide peptidase SppA [Candidatus Coprenecus stercoripullorum]|nr:signal peptide peptidase SppA [Candidatus Coprenecus stercoripullorum]